METIDVTIGNDQKVTVTLAPEDHAGNPAPVYGIPSWFKVSGDAGQDIAPDGLSSTLISGAIGDSVFQVDANVAPSGPPEIISAQINLTVVAAMAETLNPTPSAPVQK